MLHACILMDLIEKMLRCYGGYNAWKKEVDPSFP
jgi:hypothetical protein